MTLRLGVLSDVHRSLDVAQHGHWHNEYDFAGVPARIDAALRAFAEHDVDVVVLAGDLTHHADAAAWLAVVDQCVTDRPVRIVVGNHDARVYDPGLGLERVAFARPDGESRGAVRLAGVHVAAGCGWFEARLAAPPDVAAWGSDPVVLVSHYPLLSHAQRLSERGRPYPGDLVDRADAAATLAARDAPTIVISGHIHARDARTDGPVLQLTQAALVEAPFEATIVSVAVDAGRVRVARHAIALPGPDPESTPPLLVPADQRFEYTHGTWHPDPRSSSCPS